MFSAAQLCDCSARNIVVLVGFQFVNAVFANEQCNALYSIVGTFVGATCIGDNGDVEWWCELPELYPSWCVRPAQPLDNGVDADEVFDLWSLELLL